MSPELAPTPPTQPPSPSPSIPAWVRRGGWRPLLLGAVGAIAAGTYARLIGCRTGGCALLSNVGSATVAGALVGLVLGWPGPSKEP
jgi:hypothetical protein